MLVEKNAKYIFEENTVSGRRKSGINPVPVNGLSGRHR